MKLTPGKIVILVFACIFATVTAVFLAFEIMASYGTIESIYFKNNTLGDVIGGIFLWLFAFMLGIGTVISALVTLPFDIVLLKQVGKKWYSLTLLIFTIVAIVLGVLLAFSMPLISIIHPAEGGSTSISSDPSSALIFY